MVQEEKSSKENVFNTITGGHMTKQDLGFLLMECILANITVWIVGFDLELKHKLILPQVITAIIFLMIISIRLMVE